jgi:hypothetical protein
MYLLYPITIDDTNDVLGWYEDGAGTVDLTHGTYYAYRSEFSTGWPSLYDQLEDDINNQVFGTYHFESATPALSNGFAQAGLKVVRDSVGATEWGYDLGSNTLDPRIFGFNGAQQTTEATSLTGAYSRFGVWQVPGEGAWVTADGYPMKEQHRNGARRLNGVVTRWGSDEVRILEIGRVVAAHVRSYVAEDLDYADVAQLARDDFGNQWVDLWDHGISTYEDILVVYPDDARFVTDLELDAAGRQWEVVYSNRESEYAERADATWSKRSQQAHVYDLEVGFGRLPFDHDAVSGASYYRRGL